MSLAINKIYLAGSNLQTNTAAAYFQTANLAVTTAGNIALSAGLYYANTPANCTITANFGGSNVVVLAANASGLVWSDGYNVYANTTTNGTVAMITVDSGQAVSGTFNAK